MKIKMFIMDVDGTLTDGNIYISAEGVEIKAFNVKDGYGIKEILPRLGIIPVIITARESEIVNKRARELNVNEVYQGVANKEEIYEMIKEKYCLSDEEIIYMGDDLNDLEIIKKVRFSACPKDAVETIRKECTYVSEKNGGQGAVRDIIEKYLL